MDTNQTYNQHQYNHHQYSQQNKKTAQAQTQVPPAIVVIHAINVNNPFTHEIKEKN